MGDKNLAERSAMFIDHARAEICRAEIDGSNRGISGSERDSVLVVGLAHRDEAVAYSLAFARDMNSQLASKFIGMYVNEFTRDYGESGRATIRKFLSDGYEKGYIGVPINVEYVE